MIKRILQGLIRLLASYGLAIVVLFLLLVLTLLGTWEQKDLGLFEVQHRYFTSLFLLHDFGPIKLPLPGVYLLLVIFTVNLVLGTLLRIPCTIAHFGLYIMHLGMLILLLSALVTHYFAMEGQMTLAPGERSNKVSSYHEWELVVTDRGDTQAVSSQETEYIIDLEDLSKLASGGRHLVDSGGLPLGLSLDALWRNGQVMPKGPMFDAPTPVVNGFFVRPLPIEKENERNLPAAYIEIGGAGNQSQKAILWGGSPLPYIFSAAGRDWALEMRRRSWEVPFTVELKKFTRELHPGTEMAKSYESDILKIEHGQATPVTIRMNEPLRHKGFTFFQASFAANPEVEGGFNSTFAVVKNPADQWPLYACIVITSGMLLHFGIKLLRHLRQARAPQRQEVQIPLNGKGRTEKIKNRPGKLAARGLILLALAHCVPGISIRAQSTSAAENAPSAPMQMAAPIWTDKALAAFSRWPIQESGRVKPLSTFARFKLVKLSGRASMKTPDRRRLEPLPWLLETMLYPELARDYKVVRIENPAVMQALGLSDKEKRTNFSFTDLSAHDETLLKVAQQAESVPEKERSLVDQQILNLYEQYAELSRLLHAMEFARYRLDGAAEAQIRTLIGLAGNGSLDYASMIPASLLLLSQLGTQATQGLDAKTSVSLTAAQEVLNELDHLASFCTELVVIPPVSKPGGTEWLSPGTLLREVMTGGGGALPKPELGFLRDLEGIVEVTGAPGMLEQQAESLAGKLRNAAGERIQPWRLDLEILFYRANFFQYGLLLFILSFVCVALSWLVTRGSKLDRILGCVLLPLVILPTLFLVAGIVVRCVIRGRPPISTLYETTLFVPAVAIIIALLIEWINRKRIALAAASILGVIGLFLANRFELNDGNDTMTSLVAVLNSNFWLATHVTTVSIGYAAGLLAAGIAHIYIIAKLLNLKKNEPEFYKNIVRMTYGVVCFGALFSFVGTVLGGIWANYSWGRFWGWDPKENGALAIILWNLIILHARMGNYVRDLGLCLLAVCGGIIVSASWWGVNLLGVGLHSYGFTSGIMKWLVGYWAFELVVLALAVLIPLFEEIRARRESLKPILSRQSP